MWFFRRPKPPEQVRCADCGFLAMRDRKTRALVEAELNTRDFAWIPHDVTNIRVPLVEEWPICFARAANLTRELEEYNSQESAWMMPPDVSAPTHWTSLGHRFFTVIQKDRPECKKVFTEWHHGFTPKEHLEMLDRKELREFQQRQRKLDLRFQLLGLIVIALMSGMFTIYAAQLQAKASQSIVNNTTVPPSIADTVTPLTPTVVPASP